MKIKNVICTLLLLILIITLFNGCFNFNNNSNLIDLNEPIEQNELGDENLKFNSVNDIVINNDEDATFVEMQYTVPIYCKEVLVKVEDSDIINPDADYEINEDGELVLVDYEYWLKDGTKLTPYEIKDEEIDSRILEYWIIFREFCYKNEKGEIYVMTSFAWNTDDDENVSFPAMRKEVYEKLLVYKHIDKKIPAETLPPGFSVTDKDS